MRHFTRVKQRDPILPHLSSSGGKRGGESRGRLQACSAGPQRYRAYSPLDSPEPPSTETCISPMAVLWDLVNLYHLLSNLPAWPSSKQHLPYPQSAYSVSSREGSLILGRCSGDQRFCQSSLLPLCPQDTLETQPPLSTLGEAKSKWGKSQLSQLVYWVLAIPLKVTTPSSPANTGKAIIVLRSGNREGPLLRF